MKMFLDAEELEELTGKKHRDAQIQALTRMAVDHIVRPDGTAAVHIAHINKLCGITANVVSKRIEPNFEGING